MSSDELSTRFWEPRLAIAALVGLCVGAVAAPSHAQKKDEDAVKAACTEAYMTGQNLRRDGKLVEARDVILQCAQERCPDVLQRDCMQWHDELRQAIPSVVVGVRDDNGRDLDDATIILDGAVWEGALGGTERSINPGHHVFRIEYGSQHIEQRVLIRQGEKGRLLTFKFRQPPPVDAAAGASSKPGSTESTSGQQTSHEASQAASHEASRDIPPEGGSSRATWGYALGGLGLVGLGVGAYFGMMASSKWSERNDHCTDAGCDETAAAASDDAHNAALFANVGAVAGVLGLGIGSYLILTDGGDDAPDGEASARVEARIGAGRHGEPALWLRGSW